MITSTYTQPDCTNSRVVVRRHRIDWNDLISPTLKRAMTLLSEKPVGCIYLNPAVTVTCPGPTADFFREVRKRQAEWCRRAGKTVPRRVRRRVANWVDDSGVALSKAQKWFARAFCLTGVLFVNGELVHPDKWPEVQCQGRPRGYRPGNSRRS